MEFSFFDIFIAIIFAYFSISGLFRGFCKEFFSLAGLIGGLWLAYTYHAELSVHLTLIDGEAWRTIAAYGLIFIGANIVAGLCAVVLQSILTLAMLPWADKLAGCLLGIAKATFICSVVILITERFFGHAEFLQNSLLLPYLNNFIESIRAHIPHDFFQNF